MIQPKTIKVRIAVAVWPDVEKGCMYDARGWSSMNDSDAPCYFDEENTPGYQIRWIEADVPAYDEPTVTGEVVR